MRKRGRKMKEEKWWKNVLIDEVKMKTVASI